MIYDNEYEYDYHDLAANSEYLYEDESSDNVDESWITIDNNESENANDNRWDHYYHNLADEIIDD